LRRDVLGIPSCYRKVPNPNAAGALWSKIAKKIRKPSPYFWVSALSLTNSIKRKKYHTVKRGSKSCPICQRVNDEADCCYKYILLAPMIVLMRMKMIFMLMYVMMLFPLFLMTLRKESPS
jgi:hypothetical protein